MKWTAMVFLLLVVLGVWLGGSYFSAHQTRDDFRAEVEQLLNGGFDKTNRQLEEDIRRAGVEHHGIDPRELQVNLRREAAGEDDVLEDLMSGSALPSRSLHLTAEVSYSQTVLFFTPRFSFGAKAIRHKREHPHKQLIEDALSGARNP